MLFFFFSLVVFLFFWSYGIILKILIYLYLCYLHIYIYLFITLSNEIIIHFVLSIVICHNRIIYRLTQDPQALGFLYLAFGDDYQVPYYHLSRSVINDVASRYTAFQFWSERETISSAMRDELSLHLEDLYAILDDFSLSNYDLPIRFQDAIVETDVQAQEYEQVTDKQYILFFVCLLI